MRGGAVALCGGGGGGGGVADAGYEFGEGEGEGAGVGAGEVGFFLGTGLHGDIGDVEGGDVVLVWVGGGDLVLGAVGEVEVQVAGAGGGDDGLLGCGDAGSCGLGEVGYEDVAPEGCAGAGADVLDVEDDVLEVLVEDAGFDFKGGLGVFEVVLKGEEGGGGAGGLGRGS